MESDKIFRAGRLLAALHSMDPAWPAVELTIDARTGSILTSVMPDSLRCEELSASEGTVTLRIKRIRANETPPTKSQFIQYVTSNLLPGDVLRCELLIDSDPA